MTYEVDSTQAQTIEDEISELERRLGDARARLNSVRSEPVVVTKPEEPFSKNTTASIALESWTDGNRFKTSLSPPFSPSAG
jgi:hypothetical protein